MQLAGGRHERRAACCSIHVSRRQRAIPLYLSVHACMQQADTILDGAADTDVGFLVVGDPFG